MGKKKVGSVRGRGKNLNYTEETLCQKKKKEHLLPVRVYHGLKVDGRGPLVEVGSLPPPFRVPRSKLTY